MTDLAHPVRRPLTREADQEIAIERVVGFVQHFGEAHLALACHAAFPLALTPDLLYRLWACFVPQAPWTSVADILLSSLCREVGHELYEMDISVRSLLLKEIREDDRFGQQRLNSLCDFLLQYVAQQLGSNDPDLRHLAEAQRWTALSYVKPQLVADELNQLLSTLAPDNHEELFRITTLIEALPQPLQEFTPMLQRARSHLRPTQANSAAAKVATGLESEPVSTRTDEPQTVIGLEQLLRRLPGTYTPQDILLVRRAFEVAQAAHSDHKRKSGEPYILHPLAVAGILADLRLDARTVAAALLHDIAEDTMMKVPALSDEFGPEVASMVDGVTTLGHVSAMATLPSDSRDPRVESLRKLLLAVVGDVRVVLIKLADRLHNMRTLGTMPPEKRISISRETLDIYAPLAGLLGISQIEWELEDLAFRNLEPDTYAKIQSNLAAQWSIREADVQGIAMRLRDELAKHGISATVSGQPRHVYGIHRKMQRKGVSLEQVCVRRVRVIVPQVADCYAALSVVHTLWRPIKGEFDDYIANPKENQYQSLHAGVYGPGDKPLEVQIRTPEMDRIAEVGIAAHWRYKTQTQHDEAYERKITWLRSVIDWQAQEQAGGSDFLATVKEDLFRDQVYVFTPKGEVIDLPTGATPIDFAYHIHTEVGHRCRGAKVRGKMVTLDYQLRNGDQVEIITTKSGGPSRDWLNPHLGYIKTARARTKIRQWFVQQNREENISAGRGILEEELNRLSIDNLTYLDVTGLFGIASADELFEKIGTGEITVANVAEKVLQLDKTEEPLKPISQELSPLEAPQGAAKAVEGISVMGAGNMLTYLARCCNPMPPDSIVGFVTRGRGVSVHRDDCPNIRRLEPDRLVRVSWGSKPPKLSTVRVRVQAYDRSGLLNEITGILKDEHINLQAAFAVTAGQDGLALITVTLEVRDVEQLSRILTRIERLPNVREVRRHTE